MKTINVNIDRYRLPKDEPVKDFEPMPIIDWDAIESEWRKEIVHVSCFEIDMFILFKKHVDKYLQP